MKKNLFNVAVLALAVGALALSGEAFARSGGGTGGSISRSLQTKTATKVQTQTKLQSQIKTQSQQQLKVDSDDTLATPQGTAQGGGKSKLGVADGTDLEPRPLDGTGYGSPTAQTVE